MTKIPGYPSLSIVCFFKLFQIVWWRYRGGLQLPIMKKTSRRRGFDGGLFPRKAAMKCSFLDGSRVCASHQPSIRPRFDQCSDFSPVFHLFSWWEKAATHDPLSPKVKFFGTIIKRMYQEHQSILQMRSLPLLAGLAFFSLGCINALRMIPSQVSTIYLLHSFFQFSFY